MSQDSSIDLWLDEQSQSTWSVDGARFRLHAKADTSMQDARWSAAEIAQALGCGVSTASADEASEAAPAYFPPSFSHSPNTGEPLQKLPACIGAWLSPAGSQQLTTGLIRGGKLTDLPLTLQKGYAETDPRLFCSDTCWYN